jgi:hypothetical protein
MFKFIKRSGICVLVLGLQSGLGFTVSLAAPVNDARQQASQPAWSAQEQEVLAKKHQEIWRHEQAMIERSHESVEDWEWRQWQEREQHILNMQKIQDEEIMKPLKQ